MSPRPDDPRRASFDGPGASDPAEDGFLSRWSRRKVAARADAPTLERDPAPALDAEAETSATPAEAPLEEPPLEALTDEEILAKLDLPDPDGLKPGDDFSRFLAEEVPARLRRRALRKLWVTNPVLANLDELVDYGEDFTDAATVIDNLQTAYQVGRGFLRDEDQTPKADAETAEAPEEVAAAAENPEEDAPDAPAEAAEELDAADVEPRGCGASPQSASLATAEAAPSDAAQAVDAEARPVAAVDQVGLGSQRFSSRKRRLAFRFDPADDL